MVFDRLDPDLLDQVRAMAGVRQVQVLSGGAFPGIEVRAVHRTQVVDQVERLCQANGVFLLDIPQARPHPAQI